MAVEHETVVLYFFHCYNHVCSNFITDHSGGISRICIQPSSIVTEATTQAQGADGSTEMNGESDIQPADLGEESEVGRQLGSLSLQNAEPITIPHLSDEVPLNLPSTMYALPARATALEGL